MLILSKNCLFQLLHLLDLRLPEERIRKYISFLLLRLTLPSYHLIDYQRHYLYNFLMDLKNMPMTMRKISWVQFFSWFVLFVMWVFSTPAIAHHVYGLDLDDTHSNAYQNAGDWVGILFGVYNAISAIYAFFLPAIAKKLGRKRTHSTSLIIGGIGLISIYLAPDQNWLILSRVAIGIAWARILALPYAILAGSIPAK